MRFAAGVTFALFVLPVPATFLTMVAGTAAESLSERLDDNITVPVVSSLICCLLLA